LPDGKNTIESAISAAMDGGKGGEVVPLKKPRGD
jgi:hypothetical protein